MKNVSLILLILTLLSAQHSHAAGPGCNDKIETVFMIEQETCEDLPALTSWVKKCRVKNGLLIMYNVKKCTETNYLNQLKAMNVKVIFYNTIKQDTVVDKTINQAALLDKLKKDTHPPFDDQVILRLPGRIDLNNLTLTNLVNPFRYQTYSLPAGADYGFASGQKTLYLKRDEDNSIDLTGLLRRKDFVTALKTLGFDSVVYELGLIEGGDMIRVDSVIILGRRTLSRIREVAGDHPDTVLQFIRATYELKQSQAIDFFLTEDTALYHLDLFITYAGRNYQGRHQFFIGYYGNDNFVAFIEGAQHTRTELRLLYPRFDSLLRVRFGTDYQLDSVPIYRSRYLVSPLNGIMDCINGHVYYKPLPTVTEEDLDNGNEDTATLFALQRQAYRIMSRRVRTEEIGVPMFYMAAALGRGGQSLHCSVGVIRRRGQH